MEEHEYDWALISLVENESLAGKLHSKTSGPNNFFRVDVPLSDHEFFTMYLSPTAVKTITPLQESIVRGIAQKIGIVPYDKNDLPLKMRSQPSDDDTLPE